MMKKYLAVLVVVAITAFSAVAFADVTVSGSVDVRSRAYTNLDLSKDDEGFVPVWDQNGALNSFVLNEDQRGSDRYTQERVRLNLDAKVGDAKGKITLETTPDWENWQGVEVKNGPMDSVREAWLDTPLFGSVGLKAGHQFLQLGNGWFLRNMKYGDDAWLLYIPVGSALVAFADAKVAEAAHNNDADFYAGLAVFKLGESSVGVDVSHVVLSKKHRFDATVFDITTPDPTDTTTQTQYDAENKLTNLGVNANIAAGPVKLQIQADQQFGKKGDQSDILGVTAEGKYKGNQIVIQGTANAGPAAINFTLARGSGDSWNNTSPDIKQFVNFLDSDPHVAVVYEYLLGQNLGNNGYFITNTPTGTVTTLGSNASGNAVGAHQGFANTTALSVGADFKVGEKVTVGANVWYLMATKKILQDTTTLTLGGFPVGTILSPSNDLGTEIDARVNWKLNDAVSWNWVLAYFMPGDAYKQLDWSAVAAGIADAPVAKSADKATVIQGVLSMKFQ